MRHLSKSVDALALISQHANKEPLFEVLNITWAGGVPLIIRE
jgi:hypothetical protein